MELLGLWTWRACTPYIVAEHKHLQLRWTSLSLGLLGPNGLDRHSAYSAYSWVLALSAARCAIMSKDGPRSDLAEHA